MEKWYKVASTENDNYFCEYDYCVEEVIDDVDHSRDWDFYKTKKTAEKAIQRLENYHVCD